MSDFKAWFQSALTHTRAGIARRAARSVALLGGAAALSGCLEEWTVPDPSPGARAAERPPGEDGETSAATSVAAIDLQRQQGWNVGQTDRGLAFPSLQPTDADGRADWRGGLDYLWHTLAPSPRLAPFYVPTLFQALSGPGSESLAQAIGPLRTAGMDEAFLRGRALRGLFRQAGFPDGTAIVLDLPGPESVAAAAALADRFEPVFTFDNWPHPAGVVPAHETLAASIYYRPVFARMATVRVAAAPPVFVLDASRLTPYVDDGSRFDNRYLARLPPPDQLQNLGVRHVLYVSADGARATELDDLNDDFVLWDRAGVDVKMLALSDFRPPEAPPDEEAREYYADDEWPVALPSGGWSGYFYDGDPWVHLGFWGYYGWYPAVGLRGPRIHVAPPVPRHVARGFAYRAAPRATLFSTGPTHVGQAVFGGRGGGPIGGVGRVHVFGAHGGGGFGGFSGHSGFGGRSGSFGRVGGGFSGG